MSDTFAARFNFPGYPALFLLSFLAAPVLRGQMTQYVDAGSLTPVYPYTSWTTMFTNQPPTAVFNQRQAQSGALEFYRISAER